MSQKSLLAEATQRLEHLRSLPATPVRAREIASMERVIESGAKAEQPARAPRKKVVRSGRNEAMMSNCAAEDDELPPKPLREVEHDGTHRRITIRKRKPETHSEKDEESALKKERKQRISDIQNTLGLRYRGFS